MQCLKEVKRPWLNRNADISSENYRLVLRGPITHTLCSLTHLLQQTTPLMLFSSLAP